MEQVLPEVTRVTQALTSVSHSASMHYMMRPMKCTQRHFTGCLCAQADSAEDARAGIMYLDLLAVLACSMQDRCCWVGLRLK